MSQIAQQRDFTRGSNEKARGRIGHTDIFGGVYRHCRDNRKHACQRPALAPARLLRDCGNHLGLPPEAPLHMGECRGFKGLTVQLFGLDAGLVGVSGSASAGLSSATGCSETSS